MKYKLLGLGLSWLIATAPAGAEPVHLRLASPAPGPAAINAGVFAPWAEAVTAASEGTLVVEFIPGGVLGKEGQLLDRVTSGVVDMAWDFQGYYPGKFPLTGVVEQPASFVSAEAGSAAAQTLFEDGSFGNEYEGLKVLSLFTFPNASLMLTKPITNVDDLAGRKLTAQNPTMQAAAEAIGGVALNLAIPDWYPALGRGAIDGAIVTFTAVPAFRLNEVLSYYVDLPLGGNPAMFFMNSARFEGLPEAAKEAIRRHSGMDFARRTGRFLDELNEKGKKLATSTPGVVVTTPSAEELPVWQARLAPLIETWATASEGRGALLEAFRKEAAR